MKISEAIAKFEELIDQLYLNLTNVDNVDVDQEKAEIWFDYTGVYQDQNVHGAFNLIESNGEYEPDEIDISFGFSQYITLKWNGEEFVEIPHQDSA